MIRRRLVLAALFLGLAEPALAQRAPLSPSTIDLGAAGSSCHMFTGTGAPTASEPDCSAYYEVDGGGSWWIHTAGVWVQMKICTSSDTEVLFNSGGACLGDTGMEYVVGTQTLTVAHLSLTNPLTVPNGGTGLASGTSGGIPYFSSSTSIASSALLTLNMPVIGGGAGSAPTVGSVTGNTTKFATAITTTITPGDCMQWDANKNAGDSGSACGSGSGGSGTVTSVSWTGGIVSVATPTTTPAFTIAGTSGGIPYFSSSTAWASSAALTANMPVIGGGAGTAPSVGTVSGNTTEFVTTTGTQTSGDCVKIDANGNHIDAGAACGSGSGGGADFTGAGTPQGSQTAVGGQTYRDTTNGVLWVHLPLASSNTGWYVMGFRGTAAAWQINQFQFVPFVGNTGVGSIGNVLGVAAFSTNGTVTQTVLSDAHGSWLTTAAGASATNVGYWQSFTWDLTQDFDVVWKIRTDHSAVTSVRYTYYICTGDPSGDNLGGTKGFGFRFSTNASDPGWVGVNGDGTTQHVTGNLASVSSNTIYTLRMRRVGTTVYYSVNDGAETSVTSNLPSSGTAGEISMYVSALSASVRAYDFGSFGGHIGSFIAGQ